MKRNLDVVKWVLLAVEAHPDPVSWACIELPDVPGVDIAYHIKILSQGGLIEAENNSSRSGFDWKARSLTWKGHEFLDAIKNDTVWAKTKDLIKAKGGSLPFSLIGKAAAAFAANHHLLDKL